MALNVLWPLSALFWVNGWVDGWIGGWMGGRMDGWVDGVSDAMFEDPATLGLSRPTSDYANL